jgi:hypothetical protein
MTEHLQGRDRNAAAGRTSNSLGERNGISRSMDTVTKVGTASYP